MLAGHSSGDGVNPELYVDTALRERIIEFANFVLRLRDGHAVTRNDYHLASRGEKFRLLLRARRCARAGLLSSPLPRLVPGRMRRIIRL